MYTWSRENRSPKLLASRNLFRFSIIHLFKNVDFFFAKILLKKHAFNSRYQNCSKMDSQDEAKTQHLFSSEQWGMCDPVQPSSHLSDSCFWHCSKRSVQLMSTLLTLSATNSVTSRRLGLLATSLLVGTLANQAFDCSCNSWTVKVLTSQLPESLWVDPLIKAPFAASWLK